jgi:hypothetical protein
LRRARSATEGPLYTPPKNLKLWTLNAHRSADRLHLEDHTLEPRRRIAKGQDLAAQTIVGHQLGHAGELFAARFDLNGGVLDHVLAPVFPRHLAGRRVEATSEIGQTQFHSARQACFAPDCGEICYQRRAVSKFHAENIGSGVQKLNQVKVWKRILDSMIPAAINSMIFFERIVDATSTRQKAFAWKMAVISK